MIIAVIDWQQRYETTVRKNNKNTNNNNNYHKTNKNKQKANYYNANYRNTTYWKSKKKNCVSQQTANRRKYIFEGAAICKPAGRITSDGQWPSCAQRRAEGVANSWRLQRSLDTP